MANTLLTPAMITLEALVVLKNQLNFTKRVSRKYDDRFANDGAKIGDTLNVRKPPRYLGRRGQALAIEDVTQTSVPVTLSQQYGCDFSFTSKELSLSVERFAQDVMGPAIASVANSIDADGLALYKTVANFVGTPGTIPAAFFTYLNSGVQLDNNATPMDGDRCIIMTPAMQAQIVDALKGLFQSSEKIKQQYEKGRMGTAAGFDWYMDQNVFTHVVGPLGGTPQVSGSGQTGQSLLTKGWSNAAASRLKAGDIITLANVFQVNPQSRQSTGVLQPFVVLADFSSAADGTGTISIFPPMTPSGAFQTINATGVDGALISVFGTAAAGQAALASTSTPQGMAFHKDAFVFATADLPMPRGVDMGERIADPDTNVSMRIVRAYDINTDKFPTRIDILGGWAPLRQETACRIAS